MGVFDNIIEYNGSIVNNGWIEWEHFLIPNKPKWFRNFMRYYMAFLKHCLICTSLDGCYFLERRMPQQPQHDNCDCKKKNLNTNFVKTKAHSECSINKFLNYIFTDNIKSKGKKTLFESWGYNKDNVHELQKEYQNQATKEYLSGNYILKKLDIRGQRFAIPMNLNNNLFYSGWIVEPEGKIKNTTPFGGWIK